MNIYYFIIGILFIVFFIIGIILIIKSINKNTIIKQLNIEIENHNKILEEHNTNLKKEEENICNHIDKQKIILDNLKIEIQDRYQVSKKIEDDIEGKHKLAKNALEKYYDLLDIEYKKCVQEHEQLCNNLKKSYEQKQMIYLTELQKTQEELENIKKTRAAAIAAQIKEKEIKEKLSFYCLSIKDNELSDIKILERVKNQLNNPRILSMLIWQTYWQKPMTTLCNNVLGTSIVCGIYKITNQLTGECYIGQAVDIATRWKQHAKCGLGIDTPANNKLYKAIQEYGIWNFSWELIEKCSSNELNQKERYYIDLYQSYSFGFNSNTGIKK